MGVYGLDDGEGARRACWSGGTGAGAGAGRRMKKKKKKVKVKSHGKSIIYCTSTG